MEAKELRIGNYVELHIDIPECKASETSQVYSITAEDSEIKCCSEIIPDKDLWDTEEDEIKPIPLTKEWLLKFGLNTTDKFFKCTNAEFKIGIDKDVFLYSGHNGMYLRIKYVHQLQNLYFALTGQELTIK